MAGALEVRDEAGGALAPVPTVPLLGRLPMPRRMCECLRCLPNVTCSS